VNVYNNFTRHSLATDNITQIFVMKLSDQTYIVLDIPTSTQIDA
jgi:hypothetical protein